MITTLIIFGSIIFILLISIAHCDVNINFKSKPKKVEPKFEIYEYLDEDETPYYMITREDNWGDFDYIHKNGSKYGIKYKNDERFYNLEDAIFTLNRYNREQEIKNYKRKINL